MMLIIMIMMMMIVMMIMMITIMMMMIIMMIIMIMMMMMMMTVTFCSAFMQYSHIKHSLIIHSNWSVQYKCAFHCDKNTEKHY